MFALLGLIPGLFTTLNGITTAIANERIASINATTEQDRVAAQERLSTLQSRRDVMIAEGAHSNINAWIRAMIALGPAIYLLKIFLWDKVLQSLTGGSTDPLDPNLWVVVQTVLGFYFLFEASTGVARIFRSK
jgi:hypothetical protein